MDIGLARRIWVQESLTGWRENVVVVKGMDYMIEIIGNLWDFYEVPNRIICITTNGTVKKNGCCVMGRGCASEAAKRIPQLAYLVGQGIKQAGNVMLRFPELKLFTFPVKHNWWEQADLELIRDSARSLEYWAKEEPYTTFILPRPGCGNGKLKWKDVKPVIKFLPDNVEVITYD